VTNGSKTKYMNTNRNVTILKREMITDGQIFEGVRKFRYLGNWINAKKMDDEIQSRIAAGNEYFCSPKQIFRPRAMRN
jgi:hypothetical protein